MFTSPPFITVRTFSACLLLALLACIRASAITIEIDREQTDADTLVFDMIWAYPSGTGTVYESHSYPGDTILVWDAPGGNGDLDQIQQDGFYYRAWGEVEYKQGPGWMAQGVNMIVRYRVHSSPSLGWASCLDDTDLYVYEAGGFRNYEKPGRSVVPIEGNPYGARFTYELGPRTVPDGLPTVYAVVTFALLLGYHYRRKPQMAVALNR